MRPAARRSNRRATAARPVRAARGGFTRRDGFTLVEMLVSVTLVLMMMLMFAEIYSLAQQTMSTQKGIAENDQKARILAEVIRRDLDTRTFRSVYPFKLEPVVSGDLAPSNDAGIVPPIPDPGSDKRNQTLAKRQGYFSISENDPTNPTDDVLQLTVRVDLPGQGGAGDRVYGAATNIGLGVNEPEYDDGIAGNGSGMSRYAEVSYFLRNGNLYRAVLLVRDPYYDPSSSPTPTGFPTPYVQFWKDFDYSAFGTYNENDLAGKYEWRFHGPGGLSNDPTAAIPKRILPLVGSQALWLPESLGVPHRRFGHKIGHPASLVGQPREYAEPLPAWGETPSADFYNPGTPRATQFFGRFTTAERSGSLFTYPGVSEGMFGPTLPPPPADANSDGQYDFNGPGASLSRAGVDLLLSNVHAFDIQVWDDVIGDYVNLGHTLTGTNPYTGKAGEPGFYSEARRRKRLFTAPLTAARDFNAFHFDRQEVTSVYGNRYDTWNPRMFIANPGLGNPPYPSPTPVFRLGRTPYRPQLSNPDPNTDLFNAPPNAPPVDPTIPESIGRESRMAFGDDTMDDNHDAIPISSGNPAAAVDSDGEAPLRAVRIVVRFLDATSGQVRQETIEASLID